MVSVFVPGVHVAQANGNARPVGNAHVAWHASGGAVVQMGGVQCAVGNG